MGEPEGVSLLSEADGRPLGDQARAGAGARLAGSVSDSPLEQIPNGGGGDSFRPALSAGNEAVNWTSPEVLSWRGADGRRGNYPRLVTRKGLSGKFNVVRHGVSARRRMGDLYHVLLDLTWWKLGMLTLIHYLAYNCFFAFLYVLVDGIRHGSDVPESVGFWTGLFFSVQSSETIGFGYLSPAGSGTNIVVVIEAYYAQMSYAVLTGLVFAKISRPSRMKRSIEFSNEAVIRRASRFHVGPMEDGRYADALDEEEGGGGGLCLSFRVANVRKSQLCEPEFHLLCIKRDPRRQGEIVMQELGFELNQQLGRVRTMNMSVPLLALPWTVVHHINESSPLWGLDQQDLVDSGLEIIPILDGIDEACSDNFQSRWSYTAADIRWGAEHVPIVKVETHNDQTVYGIHYEDFDGLRPAPV